MFKLATGLPANHLLSLKMTEAADRIARESNGTIQFKIFSANQLGGDTDMLSQLRPGALAFLTLLGTNLATLAPAASINGLGFIFNNYDQV
jgi:TRAP-type transport system periplasmic protein